jgi:phosphoribosylglycinamide formyltransferase-1
MKNKTNLAVLISGRGSNLKAIIESIKSGYLDKVDLKVVVANKNAPGLKYAKESGIPYHIVPRIVDGNKIPIEKHDKKIMEIIEEYAIDLIVLAGYDQILQKEFVGRYKWKIMNIHPGQKDALDYGAKISGCTVHFVEEGVDTGPIIIQAAVPVKDDDSPETLANRILEHEHIIYPKAIKLFSENRLKIIGRQVVVKGDLDTSFINDPAHHMKRIGVEDTVIEHLIEKCRMYTVLVENITPREAMILKQELLSVGGDCAVPKECILNNLVCIDAILIANSIQLRSIVKKLKNQSFNLTNLAEKLEENIDNLKINND